MKTKKQIESEGYKVLFTNGTGSGGQKRNRTYSVAVVTNIEYSITRRCDVTRSANKNMNMAYDLIALEIEKLKTDRMAQFLESYREQAKKRGVIRTYNFKRGLVKNHITGKEASLQKVLNGDIELINNETV